jgi:hypothetical protein
MAARGASLTPVQTDINPVHFDADWWVGQRLHEHEYGGKIAAGITFRFATQFTGFTLSFQNG